MSAPNANAPNEGIIGQISNSVANAANYVSESIQGKSYFAIEVSRVTLVDIYK